MPARHDRKSRKALQSHSDNASRSASRPSLLLSLRWILRISGRNQAYFYLALLVDLIQAALVVLSAAYLRQVFDAVLARDREIFFYYLVLSFLIGLVGVPLFYLRTLWVGIFSERTLQSLRNQTASRLITLPINRLEERHSGDYLSLLNADLGKLKSLTEADLLGLFGQVTRAVFSLAYILTISWQLTLVSLVLTPLIFIVLSRISSPIASRTNAMQEEIGRLNAVAQDNLNGLAVTRSFNLGQILEARYQRVNLSVIQKGLSIARVRSGVDILSQLVGFSPFLITFGYGGYLAITGVITFGSLFAFINLLNYVVNPLGSLPPLVSRISESLGAIQRIEEVFDLALERSDGEIVTPVVKAEDIIRMVDVSFAYQAGQADSIRLVLEQINLTIHPGEKIAIVGPSGSGKSTLLKLLLGFYPPDEGSIFLFGEDLNRWQLPAARRQMALVAQELFLFPVSIAENIACGRGSQPAISSAGLDEIQQAANAANIHDFILTLPEGYQTLVGERGARLSGGQRQRLVLARAIYKNAPILLLDEPTSALDSESEALVQQALDRMMAQCTTIVVAHRLSTIKNADRILVLDQGRVVQQGTHSELFASEGLYRELYEKQFGFEPAGGG